MLQANASRTLLGLHKRLLSGDRTASEEIAGHLLAPLAREISRRFPRTDKHIVWDGVTDAILDYCIHPDQFDVARGVPLDRFLHTAAWRNVANSLRGEKRRKAREEKAVHVYAESLVELDPATGNLLREESLRRQRQQAQLMRTLQDQKDRQILELRMQGERRTDAFAKILGISHLPTDAQRREVKRAKDRIDKVLRRHKEDEP